MMLASTCFAGVQVVKWDKQETAKGGPFAEILTGADVFVNCILLQGNMQPFITRCAICACPWISSPGHRDLLQATPARRLRVISDVSCDPNSENNPLPIYSAITRYDHNNICDCQKCVCLTAGRSQRSGCWTATSRWTW